MRQALDFLYRASGALAAMFLVGICVVVLLQVGANAIDKAIALAGGEPIGLLVPSYAEFAGFFLAASSFLALAYTLRHGGHIRVSLLIQHLGAGPRRVIELWCLLASGLLVGYFAVFASNLVLDSLEFGDLSTGMVAVPLWIPQSALALGLIVLTIALIDEFVRVAMGRLPSYHGKGEGLLADSGSDPDAL